MPKNVGSIKTSKAQPTQTREIKRAVSYENKRTGPKAWKKGLNNEQNTTH